MKPMSLVTPEAIAREYGGNKKKIADAARMGLLDPTAAVLAGMFIDKMRAAATAEQAQDTTVAQDILGGGLQALPTPQQQQVPPMPAQAAMQAQQPQVQQPQPPQPQTAPMTAASGGIMHIPAGNVGEYANGGIVAFGAGGDTEEDEIRRMTPPHEYVPGRRRSDAELFEVPVDIGMEERSIFEPFSMRPTTSPQERLAAQLAFPPSTIGKVTKEAPPDLRIPSRGSSKTRNRLIDPEFRTDDPVKIAAEKIKILQGELENQKQALAIAKAPDEKARAEANIKEIQREISIASKGAKGAKVKPSAEPVASDALGIKQLSPDDPRARAMYDERMRRDAGVKEIPPDFVGQARRITEGVYPASERPTELTVDTAFEQSKKFLDKAGVDLDAFKKQREDIAEERKGFAKDKEEAKTMRILEAAAGILSGTSPFAAVNIGKGMTPAIQGLGSDIKEFQKNERALRAAERQLYMDEQKFNLTRASDAQAQMLKSQDRVIEYNKNKAGLIGDLTKSLVSVAGQKDVARVYTEGNIELQKMRELAPPDIVKLSDRLKADMPGKSERERLEAAADILYPGRGLSAVIGAESKASQAINEEFQNQLFTDKKLQETYKKANAGDPAAQREIDAVRKSIRDRIYANLPALSSARGGVGAAPQIGGGTMPGQFSVTAPNGKVYNFPSKEQADAFRAQIGG